MTTWPDQTIAEVADGVVAVIQGGGQAGVANAGLIIDGRSALVVDTMMFPEMAAGLVAELDARSARAEVVLNTHHHIDHIGGNTSFPDARVVAHAGTVATVHAGGHPWQIYDSFMSAFKGRFEDLEVRAPVPFPADLDVPQDAQLLSFVPAHTPADTAVWLEGPGVLFTGDLAFFGVRPLALQGFVSTWVRALDELIALSPSVVVPGHGPIGSVADLTEARDYLAAALAYGRNAVADGVELDEAVAAFDGGDGIEAERDIVNIERCMQEARGEIDATHLELLPPSFARLLA
jgi:glyoxylase-like metal-dependent hydrolase (beta-lactamase superfamily II)